MAELEAFRREIDAFVAESLGVDARRTLFLGLAGEALTDFETQWRASAPQVRFAGFVDGSASKDVGEVNIPGGTLAETADMTAAILDRALDLFDRFTKVVTGDYKAQTQIFVDDVQKDAAAARTAAGSLIVIANVAAFARKAETQGFNVTDGAGLPDGLFASIAAILRQEFKGSVDRVYYTWRTILGERVPIVAIGAGATSAGRRRRGVDNGNRSRTIGFDAAAYAKRKGR